MFAYIKKIKDFLKYTSIPMIYLFISYIFYSYSYFLDNKYKSLLIFISDISLILFLRSIFLIIYILLQDNLSGRKLSFLLSRNSHIFFACALIFIIFIIISLFFHANKFTSKFSYLFYYSYALGVVFYYFSYKKFK